MRQAEVGQGSSTTVGGASRDGVVDRINVVFGHTKQISGSWNFYLESGEGVLVGDTKTVGGVAKPVVELLIGEQALRLMDTGRVCRCDAHGYSVVDCRNNVDIC